MNCSCHSNILKIHIFSPHCMISSMYCPSLPVSINEADKIIWSAVLLVVPQQSSQSPVLSFLESSPSMLELIVIALFAGFLGIFTYDFFTKKKTEVNGAHVVVGFHVAHSCNTFLSSWSELQDSILGCSLASHALVRWVYHRRFITVNLSLFQVTGGSSGIGKAVAIKLAKCGANITILARNMVRLSSWRNIVMHAYVTF